MNTYEVTITIKVTDEAQMLKAARERAISDGLNSEGADQLGVLESLRMLLDPGESPPGTEIQDSSADRAILF